MNSDQNHTGVRVVLSYWTQRNHYGGNHLDLRKAFDTLHHSILIEKLKNYGFQNSAASWPWVESYLSQWPQQTKVNGIKSAQEIVTCGVPQGSILEPLFFTIYMSDVVESTENGNIYLYADDTAIAVSSPHPFTLENKLNENLAQLATSGDLP